MQGETQKHTYKSKLSIKIIASFLVIAIFPIIIASPLLMNEARNQLLGNAAEKQRSLAAYAAKQVDSYLDTHTDKLTLVASLYGSEGSLADQAASSLMQQDRNLQKIEILTNERTKRTVTRQGGTIKITTSKLSSDDNAADVLAGKSRLLSLTRDNNNIPLVTIGVPIESSNGAITKTIGGIIGYFKTADSFDTILPTKDTVGSTAYVVNETGGLVYHPDRTVLSKSESSQTNSAVQSFLTNDMAAKQTKSLTHEDVLSAAHTTQSGWGVIVETPTSYIYSGLTTFTHFAMTITVAVLVGAVLLGLSLSGRLVLPLRRLTTGARKLSQNNLTKHINVKTNDELQEIADILNNIGATMTNLVTNLQANNQDLSFEQSQLQSIINNVNDGVIAVNSHGEIMSINASAMRLVGQIHTAVQGKSIDEIFPWTYESKPLRLDLSNPGLHTYKDIVLTSGEVVSYLDLMVEVLDHGSSNVAAIITIHDQTYERQLDFLKLDFVAIAAHELRTPLTVISGYLDTLSREATGNLSPENAEDLKRAVLGTGQLRELINKLLNIARIERGDMEIFLDKLDMSDLVTRNVEQHQSIAAQKQQTLTLTTNTSDSVFVPADTASIVEVLNNLIGNALKYTPEGGKIHVNILKSTEEVYVEVIDNGPGIPDDLRAQLFTKFYRAERNMISGTRGTGLGLFISKTIIELQRGTIGIKPDTGNGSVFYFTLPIYNPERDDASIMENVSRGKYGWFKKRSDR